MLIRCEFKKILRRPWFGAFILAGLILNFIFAANQCREINKDTLYAPKRQIYEEYGGILTREKINWIQNQYKALSEQVAAGEFNTDWNEKYYSGYLFGDCSILEEMYTRLTELSSYQNHRNVIRQKTEQASQLYHDVGNQQKIRLMDQLSENYANRNITVLQDDSFFLALVQYQGSSFVLIILALYLFTGLAEMDRELGTDALLCTTVSGKKWVPIIRPAAGVLLFLALSSLFYLEDCLIFGLFDDRLHTEQPLYFAQGFGDTFFSGSIGMFLLTTAILRGIGIAVFGLFCSFLVSCIKNQIFSFAVCLFVLFALFLHIDWTDAQHVNWWNPLGSLTCRMWYQIPMFVSVWKENIVYPWFALGIEMAELAVGYIAFVFGSKIKR